MEKCLVVAKLMQGKKLKYYMVMNTQQKYIAVDDKGLADLCDTEMLINCVIKERNDSESEEAFKFEGIKQFDFKDFEIQTLYQNGDDSFGEEKREDIINSEVDALIVELQRNMKYRHLIRELTGEDKKASTRSSLGLDKSLVVKKVFLNGIKSSRGTDGRDVGYEIQNVSKEKVRLNRLIEPGEVFILTDREFEVFMLPSFNKLLENGSAKVILGDNRNNSARAINVRGSFIRLLDSYDVQKEIIGEYHRGRWFIKEEYLKHFYYLEVESMEQLINQM